MVILYVAPLYEAKEEKPQGGISMYLRRVTGALKELGHTPIILTLGQEDMHYTENGVEIYFIRWPYIHLGGRGLESVCNILVKNVFVNRKVKELLKARRIVISILLSLYSRYTLE